jgi:hypothetical protein
MDRAEELLQQIITNASLNGRDDVTLALSAELRKLIKEIRVERDHYKQRLVEQPEKQSKYALIPARPEDVRVPHSGLLSEPVSPAHDSATTGLPELPQGQIVYYPQDAPEIVLPDRIPNRVIGDGTFAREWNASMDPYDWEKRCSEQESAYQQTKAVFEGWE